MDDVRLTGLGAASARALMKALDDGDLGALPVLADALEEMGLPSALLRTEKVRLKEVAPAANFIGRTAELQWCWVLAEASNASTCFLDADVFQRLRGGVELELPHIDPTRAYATVAEALIDLAQAVEGDV